MAYQPLILTPQLRTFDGGRLFISFDDDQTSFMAGQMLKGSVIVELDEEFPADKLTLCLKGVERTSVEKKGDGAVFNDKRSEEFINLEYVLAEFIPKDQKDQNKYQPIKGYFTYKFDLHLPSTLPDSCMLQDGANNLSNTYYLVAQMVPKFDEAELFTDQVTRNSVLRSERIVYIREQSLKEYDEAGNLIPVDNPVTKSISYKVGDLVKKESTAKITMFQDTFEIGEPLKVLMEVDNSKVSKKVKSYKFKLQRTYKVFGKNPGEAPITNKVEIFNSQEPGCDPKSFDKRELFFSPPLVDPVEQVGSVQKLHPDLSPLVKRWSTSNRGKLFEIIYMLDVYVKHDSWNEFGKGQYASFPIRFVSPA